MREQVVRNFATEMGIRGALTKLLEARETRVEILHGRGQHPISSYAWDMFTIASKAAYLHDDLGEAQPGIATDLMPVSSGQHDYLA